MKKYIYITGLILSSVFLYSCGGKNLIMPEASGEAFELVVVYDRYVLNNTPVPDTVSQWFSREIKGLPQAESFFKIYNIDEGNFGTVFKFHRNVLLVNIDPKVSKKGIAIKEDSWARGQMVVQMLARNRDEFLELFRENKTLVERYFVDKEMERQASAFAKIKSSNAVAPFKDSLDVSIVLPDGFYTVKSQKDFVFSKHVAEKSTTGGMMAKIERGVWVHTFPYTEQGVFTVKRAVEIRDSLTAIHIPDAKEGAYMIVEPRLKPDSASITLNGEYCLITKGLWRIKEGFKGGPFVNLMTYNKKTNQIIMADGYVYAPEFNKKSYIHQIEAILRTVN
ncbi:MAG: DUF4837 family protein [Flavobacteriales bacterium]|nr:DUF4837 family protein [Flavobacteriales bacterium]